jgi:hypothetical protein
LRLALFETEEEMLHLLQHRLHIHDLVIIISTLLFNVVDLHNAVWNKLSISRTGCLDIFYVFRHNHHSGIEGNKQNFRRKTTCPAKT